MQKRPNPGKMRFQIILWKPSSSADDSGQVIHSFTNEKTIPASVREVKGRLTDDGQQEMAGRRTREFIIRADSGIDYGWQIEYRGQRHRVERIDDWDQRGRMQIIYAFEVDL